MIADGQVEPVGHELVTLAPEHLADVGRVLARRVEVGVIANLRRQVHLHLGARHEAARLPVWALAERRISCVPPEQARQPRAHGLPVGTRPRHEVVERVASEHVRGVEGHFVEQALCGRLAQVQDAVTDRNARTWVEAAGRVREDSKRQVLDGEVATVRAIHPRRV